VLEVGLPVVAGIYANYLNHVLSILSWTIALDPRSFSDK